MSTSIELQIELVNQLIASLNYYSELLKEGQDRYQKYISVLENNGLFNEALKNLQDNYFANTSASFNNLIEHIQQVDINDAKQIMSQLEDLRNSALQ